MEIDIVRKDEYLFTMLIAVLVFTNDPLKIY